MLNTWFLNGKDIYAEFGARIQSDKDNFLLLGSRKETVKHSWAEENGTEHDLTSVFIHDLELTLDMIIEGSTRAEFFANRAGFYQELLRPGSLLLRFEDYGTEYNVHYESMANPRLLNKRFAGKDHHMFTFQVKLTVTPDVQAGTGPREGFATILDVNGNLIAYVPVDETYTVIYPDYSTDPDNPTDPDDPDAPTGPHVLPAIFINPIPLQEKGSTGTVTVSGTITPNDETSISNRILLKNGVQVAVGSGLTFSFQQSVAEPTTFRYELTAGNRGTPTVIGASAAVPFGYKNFVGAVAVVPPSGANDHRSLTSAYVGTNPLTLNTGTEYTAFVILIAPGLTLTSVNDLDAMDFNIMSEFTLVNTNYTGKDAGGNDVSGYKLYVKKQTVPYLVNHRFSIIIL